MTLSELEAYNAIMLRASQLEQLSLDLPSERENYWLSLVKWDDEAIDVSIALSRSKHRDEWKALYNKRNELKQRYSVAENQAAYRARMIAQIIANP